MKKNQISLLITAFTATVLFVLFVPTPARADDIRPNSPGGNVTLHQPAAANEDVLAMPSTINFDTTLQALTEAINSVNATQTDGTVDPSDLQEDYDNFSRQKFEEVQNGSRSYKYLVLQEYWKEDGATEPLIQAVVKVPDSEDTSSETTYLDAILDHMQTVSHLNVSNVNPQQKKQIVQDIAEINRLTCIKVLRLVWALFGDESGSDKGIFPQVYQAKVVQAGDLVDFADGGVDLFSEDNMHTIQPSKIKYANVSNEYPEARPDVFTNKVVAFFRTQSATMVDGHIGVGKIYSEAFGDSLSFSITSFEVDGETGRASFHQKTNLDEFTARLYPGLPKPANLPRQIIGWFFNR